MIRSIIQVEDSSRSYLASSPTNGLKTEQENWISNYPNDNLYGDTHYYNYFSDPLNWKNHPNSRFVSEYGYQSYPSLQTLSLITNVSQLTYPINSVIEHHQHLVDGTSKLANVISTHFNLPAHGGVERFEDLIYLSQIIQALGVKSQTEFYRRNRQVNQFTGEGYTMGALYWMLNDIWPAPTWSSIEFGGKWKMLHYYAKKMFDNLLVSPYEDNGIIKVAIVRDDLLKSLAFQLKISVYKWSSLKPTKIIKENVMTEQLTSNLVFQINTNDLLRQANCSSRQECFIYFDIENKMHNLYVDNFLLLEPFKNVIGLNKSNIKATVQNSQTKRSNDGNNIFTIEIETNAIAPFVWLDFKVNVPGTFSDNGFFIVQKKKIVTFNTDFKHDNLYKMISDNLIIKSLTDVNSR